MANNANISMETKNSSNKMLSPSEDWTQDLWFQVQHSPFWANLALTCKTKTLGSLYSHALLILTKSPKSKSNGAWTEV